MRDKALFCFGKCRVYVLFPFYISEKDTQRSNTLLGNKWRFNTTVHQRSFSVEL